MNIQNLNLNNVVGSKDNALLNNSPTNKVANETSFGEMLNRAISDVNNDQIETEEMNNLLAIGEVENLHDVTISAQKAELALNLAIEVRNKVVEAYKEIMRLQF